MNHLLLPLCLLFGATALPAQSPIVLRGEVTDGSSAGCYYCPGYEHVIKHSGTQLHSSSIDLNAFMDQQVRVVGTWDGAIVEVTSVELIDETFSISGGGSIGTSVEFTAHGTPGQLAVNFAALGASTFVPLAGLGVLLDPFTLVALGFGVLDGNGEFGSEIAIPDATSLIGVRLFGQAIVFDQVFAPTSTNVDAKQLN